MIAWTRDIILAVVAVAIYRVYWLNLSVEERFVRRNKLK